MSKRIIAVIGATGSQGGSVVRALLNSGNWTVRAITRKPDSPAALALKEKGAEIVVANIDNADDLAKAFAGAYGVFGVTNFYEAGEEGELRQGKLAVDVAKQQHVTHFVFAGLSNVKKVSGDKYNAPHFTGKAEIDDYLFASGLTGTSVQIACYYENFTSYFIPRPTDDGGYAVALAVPPDTQFATASVADIGAVVEKVFENKDEFAGKIVPVAGSYLSPNELVAVIAKVWGKPVTYNYIPREVYAKFPFPHAGEFADMFAYFGEFGYYGEKANGIDIWAGKKLVPNLKTWEQFVHEHLSHPPAPAPK